MPCTKCKDDKYKWGKTGECEYATKEACESANHKYSKMQPTPLGKKSYEEYEKELKEYNLSKVERVELKSIKILKENLKKGEQLFKEAKKEEKVFSEAKEKYIKSEKKLDNTISVLDGFANQDLPKDNNMLISAAKELGISPDKIKELQETRALRKKLQSLITDLKGSVK